MEPGTVIGGRYVIARKLGQGGMSTVWVATDDKFDRAVALKVATPRGAGVAEFRARFKREARIGQLLGAHAQGFVRVLDWGDLPAATPDADDALWLVMDLIEGGVDLDLATGSRDERLERLLRAARLVREAHRLGIVHRDLKPSNFLLRPDGAVFLTDFGLAKVVGTDDGAAAPAGDLTQTGSAMGTPYYMAPEQFDAKHVDTRADVYSLGVMLHLALTGDLPFKGSIPELLGRLNAAREGLLAPPSAAERDPSVPAALDAIGRRCQAYDPAARPTVADLVAALQAHLGELTPSRPLRPAPATGRRPGGPALSDAATQPISVGPAAAKAPTGVRPAPGRGPAKGAPARGAPKGPPAKGARPPQGPPPKGAPAGLASAPRRAQGPGTPGEDAGLLFVSMAPGAVLDDGPAEAAPADAPAFAVDPTADTGPHRALPGGGEGLPLGLRRVAAREVEALVDGSVLVEVPGGSYFPRLPDPGDRSTLKQVPVRAFLIGKTPVTWGQYRRYCAATGRAAPAPEHPVTDAHPVHGVTWDDARAYCAWAGLRLPTEAEREYAASGEEQRRFPWGDEPPTAERCNFAGAGLGATTPVGARPAGASPFGVLDLAGNVLEWVDDGRPAASTRPLRGGAFRHDAALCEVRRRHLLPAVAREGFVGFRVARDAPGAAGPAAPAPVAAAAGVPAPGPGAAAPRATGRTARPSDRIEVRSSGEHPGLADEARAVAAGLAEGLVGCLPPEAGGASRKGAEVRLTFTPPGGTRGVPLSLIVVDPVNGVAVVEQRVTLDRATLQGPPTGWLNLLRAANAATAAGLGLACAPGADRLRWRRPLVLQRAEGQPPSTPARVREAAQRLIDGWKAFVEPVKRALHGEPWPAALRACLPDGRPPAPPARALDDLGRRVPEAWTRVKQQEGLAVWPGIPREAAPVVLVPGDEVTATRLLRPWAGTRQDAAALRAGEPCPRVDALLEQLAARNTLGPAALAWEAGRGVVARLALGATSTGEDLERAAAVLLEAGDGLEGRGW